MTTTDTWPAVHRLAANRSPDELTSLAVDTCTALMAHYQIAVERWQAELGEIVDSGCRCEGCSETIIGFAENIAQAEVAKAKIVAAGDLLTGLALGLPAAEPEEIERFVEEVKQHPEADQ